jgi:hypothetical protein
VREQRGEKRMREERERDSMWREYLFVFECRREYIHGNYIQLPRSRYVEVGRGRCGFLTQYEVASTFEV